MYVLTCQPQHVPLLLHVPGCFGKGGVHIQALSDHIKITINNESMSHVCAGQILTHQERQSCQLVSLILNVYIWLVQPDAVLLLPLGIF